MERKVFISKLFSNKREKLINKCIELQRKGKSFIYLLPSSAALNDVRIKFAKNNKGFLGSKIIVFDDLEMDIIKEQISKDSIVYAPSDKLIISETCSTLKNQNKLIYYKNISNKKGFHEEVINFIRNLKRNCKSEEFIFSIKDKLDDELTVKKLEDLVLIYKNYNKALRKNNIYDRNDISLKAIELVDKYETLKNTDSIIIDGFTDIDTVSMKLIKKIAEIYSLNIYVSCPYSNKFIKEFLQKEIDEPFKAMGFDIVYEEDNSICIENSFKELGEKFYSGDKVKIDMEALKLYKYPCIEAEVRETARSIKKKLMAGEKAEEIAVFINNKNDYESTLIDIFKEFNIPISLNYQVPIGTSEILRKIVRNFNPDDKNLSVERYIDNLLEEIEAKKSYVAKLIEKASDAKLVFEDIVEIKAIDALKNSIYGIKAVVEKENSIEDHVTIEYFIDIFNQCLKDIKVTIEKGNNSGIRILNNALAKAVYFNHIYVLGLNEGEIPKSSKSSGLFDNVEAKVLAQHGIRYKDYLWELNREKIRFNLTLSSAKESITLSYRGTDEDGKFAIASPFVDEIKFMTGLEENKKFSMRDRFQLSYDEVMSKSELEKVFIKEYFENKYADKDVDVLDNKLELVREFNADIDSVINKGLVEYHREKEKDFNEYEGILGKDFTSIADKICEFSPSKLNEYISCPFKYMMSTLFKLDAKDEINEIFTDFQIACLYCDVLYEYYSKVNNYDQIYRKELDNIFYNNVDNISRLKDILEEKDKMKIDKLYKNIENFIDLDLKRMSKYKEQTNKILIPYTNRFINDKDIFQLQINCKVDRVDIECEEKEGKYYPTGRYIIYIYKKKTIKNIRQILEDKNEMIKLGMIYYLVDKQLKIHLKKDNVNCMGIVYLGIEGSEEKINKNGIYKTSCKAYLDFVGKNESDVEDEKFYDFMENIKSSIIYYLKQTAQGKFNYNKCNYLEGDYNSYPCGFEKICRYSKNKIRIMVGE